MFLIWRETGQNSIWRLVSRERIQFVTEFPFARADPIILPARQSSGIRKRAAKSQQSETGLVLSSYAPMTKTTDRIGTQGHSLQAEISANLDLPVRIPRPSLSMLRLASSYEFMTNARFRLTGTNKINLRQQPHARLKDTSALV